ncbi:MAG: hypothetical protein F6K47_19705 [Symploca sp. SIO2E6]|nr:hypothetical protein [Symploca sp. SIO2E6]
MFLTSASCFHQYIDRNKGNHVSKRKYREWGVEKRRGDAGTRGRGDAERGIFVNGSEIFSSGLLGNAPA